MRDSVTPTPENSAGGNALALPMATVRLVWADPWQGPPVPHLLRGAIAAAYPDNDLFHQHAPDGAVLYRYPRIHYRWDRGDGLLVGFGPGVEALAEFFSREENITLRLGTRTMRVREVFAEFELRPLRALDELRRYRFRSPWLPLSQENYARYNTMPPDARSRELDRLAVANLLSAFKGLGIRCNFRILASFLPSGKRWCRYKDTRLLGFRGLLTCNIELPDGFAIGRAVSHGYGWLSPDHPREDAL